jgi:hypothetical protein
MDKNVLNLHFFRFRQPIFLGESIKMNKYRYLNVLLFVLIFSGCVSTKNNWGELKRLPKNPQEVNLQNLIDQWEDYHIYYAGLGVRSPLGVMFDPKNNDTILVGDEWKKVTDQKDLVEITQWISAHTQREPWLNKILGSDGRFYGYLYYSYGPVALEQIARRKIYVFNLEEPLKVGAIQKNQTIA